MCRHICLAPGFPRLQALEILLSMEDRNTDGTGYGYVKDGEFIVQKWPKSLSKVLNDEPNFLDHLPYNDGYTIVHLRAASHGGNKKRNTHPFIVGRDKDWLISHNGIFSSRDIVRLALSPFVEFHGETDTEVAAQLLALVGPKKFSEEVDFSGTFFALQKTGDLWVVKTSGELSIHNRKNNTVLISSELPKSYNCVEAYKGWYHFNSRGNYIEHEKKKDSFSTYSPAFKNGCASVQCYSWD